MPFVTIAATTERFAVGKIVCVARNYGEHARELGNQVPPEPIFFLKPPTAIIGDGGTLEIPAYSNNCHHEVELAVLIGRTGRAIPEEMAMAHVAGYGVALDMTLRDVQASLKEQGLPWEKAKAFDGSCPLSEFVPAAQIPDPHDLAIALEVNGSPRQDATTAGMLRNIPQLIAACSQIFTLEKGDVILTGTPAGVGQVRSGDRMLATVEGIGKLEVSVR